MRDFEGLCIGLSGSWDYRFIPQGYLWDNIRGGFKKNIPNAPFVLERRGYSPWQGGELRAWEGDLVKTYGKNRKKKILVGYSMGGNVAVRVAPQLPNVCAVVTIFSPHTFLGGVFPWILGSNPKKLGDIPVLSFSGWFDGLVLTGSEYPNGWGHHNLFFDHFVLPSFLPSFGETIGQKTAKLLASRRTVARG